MEPSDQIPTSRLDPYLKIIQLLKEDDVTIETPAPSGSDLDRLGEALSELAHALAIRHNQARKLEEIFVQSNAGLTLNEALEQIYQHFRDLIPYNRIGVALLEDNNRTARSVWVKSDLSGRGQALKLKIGYAAPLAGSSLETILLTGQARIINDLEAYLLEKPYSASTRLMLAEGIHASLTCPLIANKAPIGFIFFSSANANTYTPTHIDFFQKIASPIASLIERGGLVSELAAKKAEIEAKDNTFQQINDHRSAFMGIAAHDLRGPIGNIQLITQLLLEKDNPLSKEQQTGLISDIARQSAHVLQLIDDLQDITQIQVGKLSLEKKCVTVSDFVEETVSRHLNSAAIKQTQILLERVPPGELSADPIRLQQALDNLISNALKYSPAASTIRVRVEHHAPLWTFYVQDQGPGIAAEDYERLYQEFARLSARPTGGEKSVGLGLTITKWIVEAHGGQIHVDSKPDQGAVFWFSLPEEK